MGNLDNFLKKKYNIEQLHAIYEDGKTKPLRNILLADNEHGHMEGIIIWKNNDGDGFMIEVLGGNFFLEAYYPDIDKLKSGIGCFANTIHYIVVDYYDEENMIDGPDIGLIKDTNSGEVEAISWDEEWEGYEDSDMYDSNSDFPIGRVITEDEFMQEVEKLLQEG
jgi:hypothetical protein